MSNGSAIVLGAVVIGIAVAASGTVTQLGKRALAQQEQSACWSPDLKSGINQLASEVAQPEFKSSLPLMMSAKDQKSVLSSLKIKLSGFAFTGASADHGTINCNAALSVSYTRPDGSTYTNHGANIAKYIMHPAADGWSYEMSGAGLPTDVITYKPNAQSGQANSN